MSYVLETLESNIKAESGKQVLMYYVALSTTGLQSNRPEGPYLQLLFKQHNSPVESQNPLTVYIAQQ